MQNQFTCPLNVLAKNANIIQIQWILCVARMLNRILWWLLLFHLLTNVSKSVANHFAMTLNVPIAQPQQQYFTLHISFVICFNWANQTLEKFLFFQDFFSFHFWPIFLLFMFLNNFSRYSFFFAIQTILNKNLNISIENTCPKRKILLCTYFSMWNLKFKRMNFNLTTNSKALDSKVAFGCEPTSETRV